MISKIVVPTDFSNPAKQALNYAIALAKKLNAELSVLHVNQVALVDATMPAETYQLFVKEIEDQTTRNFNSMEMDILKPSGINYTMHSRYGFVAEEICDFAQVQETDLIVLGTTGATGAAEVLFGSNAASVVAKTHIPVMVIPADSPYKDLKRIVYATDYNEPEFPAMMRLVYFAEQYDCPLDVVHVKSESDRYFNSENNFFKKNKANISYPNINFVELEKGDVEQSINQYVEDTHTDLLVIAKHNRNFFDRLFHRSLSKKMAFHTRIPLLVLVKN
ncbi:MAG: universal stress protein [Bacteroidia bacterium]|nr:universal stress protein [Bacteroidia bacterium]MCF8425883.1 universal stress protein [Bacteroidia bacterium]MCF8445662.1 universal stress protein [Bacteroidia bacterium]